MKKVYTVFIALTVLSSAAFSQSDWCGTDHSEAFMAQLTKNVKYANTHPMKMDEKRFIPLKVHSIGDSNGNGHTPLDVILVQICRMNIQYENIGFVFYLDGDVNYIDDTSIFEHQSNAGNKMEGIANGYPGSMNLFIPNQTSGENTLGYYSPSRDILVVRKSSFASETNETLGHEGAHFFTISHPHYGWEDEPYTPEQYGEIVTITTIESSQSPTVEVEIMNDPRCDETGDRICDTPPDYGFTQNGGNGQICSNPWAGFVKDRNGVLIESLSNLIMGYNNNCPETVFTEGQAEAMVADYIDRVNRPVNDNRYMSSGYTPDTTEITELPVLISPLAFETTDNFDSVVLQWEASPGAQAYLVKVGGQANFQFETTDTELELTELEPGKSYSWSVTPINEIGHCLTALQVLFFTGTGSTSVNDIAEVNAFAVHPNPVSAQSFNITIDSKEALDANISLLNIAGQTILSQQASIKTGSNLIPVQLDNIQPGVYQLYIRSSIGILTEKLIIK